MKLTRLLVGFFVIAAILGMSFQPVAAQSGGFTYTSGFQVQNLSTSAANITLSFVSSADGSVCATCTVNDTVAASGSKTYFPLPQGVSSGFKGSVVISSSTQLASVVNIIGTSPTGVQAAASYVGSGAGPTTVLLPLLMSNNSGYSTWFNVQNTGTANTDITVTYSDNTTKTITAVKPNQAVTFDQATETHNLKVFSGTVTATGGAQLAATVVEVGPNILFAYSGFDHGSPTVIAPLINMNNSGYVTGMQVQNSSTTTDAVVTVSYTPSQKGTACTETQTVPRSSSRTFTLQAFAAGTPPAGITTNCAGGQPFVGSAVITSPQNVNMVAVVNQLKPGVNGEAYGAFDPTTAGGTVVLPLIMDRNGGFYTAFSVTNVGTAAATVSCTFTGTTYTVSQSVAPNSSLVDAQLNKIGTKYAGSATCTAPGGKLVGVVNELNPSAAGANLLVYEAINAGP